ncbi:hypothetical protein [Haliangium sp.]|uniref:hypothetical protein n=1 Tax=Haliangium sp. TaxID=2663208 RepID=UPI003D0E054D
MSSLLSYLPAAARARLRVLDTFTEHEGAPAPDDAAPSGAAPGGGVSLQTPLQPEPRAACDRCVMVPVHPDRDPGAPWAFDDGLRCCTHHPAVPNFLVGRTLMRGGPGVERVRARLATPASVSAWGIRAPPDRPADTHTLELRFGRDPDLLCPFWTGGALACGIWPERTASCRTWFCKHERGFDGAQRWWRLGDLLSALERALGRFCVDVGAAPESDATTDQWLDWYRWCAARVDEFDHADAERLDLSSCEAPRQRLVALRVRPRSMPAVLVPAISALHEHAGGVLIAGYSSYDAVLAPRAIFAFLALLDGTCPWREALARTTRERPDPRAAAPGLAHLDEALIRELYRIGALEPASQT